MKRTTTYAITGLMLAGAAIWAQNQPKLTPREAFFLPFLAKTNTPPAKPTPKAPKAPKAEPKEAPKAVAQNEPKRPQPINPISELPGGAQIIRVSTPAYEGPKPMGLRYSILKMNEDKSFSEVPPRSAFHAGDRLRVQVQSNEEGYLYIIAKGTSGKWDVLFPSPKLNGGDNFIEAMQPQTIPNGRGVWTLDEKAGEERLFMVFSRKPVGDLDKLIYDLNTASKGTPKTPETKAEPKPTSTPAQEPAKPKRTLLAGNIAPIDDALVGRLRSNVLTRDLVFEEVVDDKTPADKSPKAKEKEFAVYVTENSGRPDARLIADIRLVHK